MAKALFMTDEEFRQLLEREIQFTAKLVKEVRPRDLPARFVVIGQTGEGQPNTTKAYGLNIPDEGEAKHKLFTELGARCYKEDKLAPLAAFISIEAWVSRQTGVQPREALDRQESVVVSGRTIDGRDCMGVSKIFRDTGSIIRLGNFEQTYHSTENFLLKAFFDSFMLTAFNDLKGKGVI